jgi:hypothetical protein
MKAQKTVLIEGDVCQVAEDYCRKNYINFSKLMNLALVAFFKKKGGDSK